MEKERLAKATIEERREVLVTKSNSIFDFLSLSFCSSSFLSLSQGYSCGDKYERLEDIPTLKETPPPHLSEKDKKRMEEKLLKNFPLEEDAGDLSDKVRQH